MGHPPQASAGSASAGILVTAKKTPFHPSDEAAGIQPAQTFAGHEVLRFEARQESLTLLTNGATSPSTARLKDAKVQPAARSVIGGALSFGGGAKRELSRATLVFDPEKSFPLRPV